MAYGSILEFIGAIIVAISGILYLRVKNNIVQINPERLRLSGLLTLIGMGLMATGFLLQILGFR